MTQYWDEGEVKLRLSNLFKPDLGFIKSANLAGEMATMSWFDVMQQYRDCNYEQKALVCLIAAANSLLQPHPPNSISVYLWCHQKVMAKRGWFFSIGATAVDKLAACQWLLQKADVFADQTGQSKFLKTLTDNRRWPRTCSLPSPTS